MTARIYGTCEECGHPVRLPRRTFRALLGTQCGTGMMAFFLCTCANELALDLIGQGLVGELDGTEDV